jgi:radical SAM protein with 4Fe4S-binding SPASM domain
MNRIINNEYLFDCKTRNREINIREYERGELVLSSYPQIVFVELTQNCNLFCNMCRSKTMYNSNKNMDVRTFTQIAEQVFPYAEAVDLRGFGESTLLKDLSVFIDFAKKYQVGLRLFTNLTVASNEIWDLLAKNEFTLAISFDGGTKDTFERIRNGSNFDIVLNNLCFLVNSYVKYGFEPSKHIYFSTTIQKDNINEIIDIMTILKTHGLKTIKIFPIGCDDKDERNLIHHETEIKKSLIDSTCFANENGINLELGESLHPSLTLKEKVIEKCIHPWAYVFFDYKGRVGFCDNLIGEDTNLMGNINVTTFKEIWNNSQYIDLRKRHVFNPTKKNISFSNCDRCYLRRYDEIEHLFYPLHSRKIVSTKFGNII